MATNVILKYFVDDLGEKAKEMRWILSKELGLKLIWMHWRTISKGIQSKLATGEKVMGIIVKADAYGHGDGFVARALQEAGFDWFGVSNNIEKV